jgi:MFS family permease
MTEIKKILSDSAPLRWAMLLLVSFTMAANYYFYDAMSPLQTLLETHLKFSPSDYGFLMSTYSIPNVFLFMAVIGGIFLDKVGIRISGLLFVILMVIGALITAYGASDAFRTGGIGYGFMNSFWTQYTAELKMMSLGFFLFGFGAESGIVVISKVVVKWFKGKELAFALATNVAIARIGTTMALNVSPRLVHEPNDWNFPITFAALLMCLGLLTFLIYMIYDVRIDKQVKTETLMDKEEEFHISDVWKLLKTPSFVYIALLCVTFYSAVFPFIKFSTSMMENKFGFTAEWAGTITSILPLGTILFTPLFGWLTDKKGKSASIMILGSALLILVHLTFTFTTITPYIPMFILGIAFSLVPAAMWPSVAKIVDESRIGTAYGLMFSIQNFGLWLFPMLLGIVLTATNPGVTPEMIANKTASYNYTYPILMLAGLGVLGLVFAFLLRNEDKTSGFGLELPNKK